MEGANGLTEEKNQSESCCYVLSFYLSSSHSRKRIHNHQRQWTWEEEMKGNRLAGKVKLVRTGENGKRIMDALEEKESEFFLLTQISHLFSSNSQITTKVINPSFYFLFTFNFRSVFLSHHFFSHFLSKLLFPFISKRRREYFHPFVPIQHTMTKLRFNVNYGSILHNVDDDDYFGREHFWGRKLTSYNYTKERIIKNEPLFVLVCFHEATFFLCEPYLSSFPSVSLLSNSLPLYIFLSLSTSRKKANRKCLLRTVNN